MAQCPHCQTVILHCPCCGGSLPAGSYPPTPTTDAARTREGKALTCTSAAPADYTPPTAHACAPRPCPPSAKQQPHIVITLEPREYSIGRGDAATGVFPDIDLSRYDAGSLASRRHARITFRDQRFLLEDVGSINGTYLLTNDFRVRLEPSSPCVLHDGDTVRFGGVDVQFKLATANATLLTRTARQQSRVTTELG